MDRLRSCNNFHKITINLVKKHKVIVSMLTIIQVLIFFFVGVWWKTFSIMRGVSWKAFKWFDGTEKIKPTSNYKPLLSWIKMSEYFERLMIMQSKKAIYFEKNVTASDKVLIDSCKVAEIMLKKQNYNR